MKLSEVLKYSSILILSLQIKLHMNIECLRVGL